MRFKKATALLLAGVVAASLMIGGCGSSIDSDAIVATCGDEELTLGYMNFYAHYTQANYDSMFVAYYGEDYWTNEAYIDEDGNTMEDSIKNAVMEEAELECVLDEHRADYGVEITDEELEAMQAAGEEFMSENEKDAINAMGATADYVAQMLYYQTVAERMQEAIEAEVGEDLDIADYARRTFSYIQIDTAGYTDEDGDYVEYTDDDFENLENEAEIIDVEAKNDFDQAAEDFGYTVSTYSYGEDEDSEEDGGFSEAVIQVADTLQEGEVSDVIDGGDYLYIIRLDSEDDQDAAESAMSEASSQIKSDHFSEVTEEYLEDTEITVDESLWEKVKFSSLFEITEEEE